MLLKFSCVVIFSFGLALTAPQGSRSDGEVTIRLVLHVQKTENGGLVLNFEQNPADFRQQPGSNGNEEPLVSVVSEGGFPVWISTGIVNTSEPTGKPYEAKETFKKDVATAENLETKSNQPRLTLRRMVQSSSPLEQLTSEKLPAFFQRPKLEFKISLGGNSAKTLEKPAYVSTATTQLLQPVRSVVTTESNKQMFVTRPKTTQIELSRGTGASKEEYAVTTVATSETPSQSTSSQDNSSATVKLDQGVTSETPSQSTSSLHSSFSAAELDQGVTNGPPTQSTPSHYNSSATVKLDRGVTVETSSQSTSYQENSSAAAKLDRGVTAETPSQSSISYQENSSAAAKLDRGVTDETPIQSPTSFQYVSSSATAKLVQGVTSETPSQSTSSQHSSFSTEKLDQGVTNKTLDQSSISYQDNSSPAAKLDQGVINETSRPSTSDEMRSVTAKLDQGVTSDTPSPSTAKLDSSFTTSKLDIRRITMAPSQPTFVVRPSTATKYPYQKPDHREITYQPIVKEPSSVPPDSDSNDTLEEVDGIVWDVKAVADQGFGVLASPCAGYGTGLVSDGAGGCTKPVTRPVKNRNYGSPYTFRSAEGNELHADVKDQPEDLEQDQFQVHVLR